MIDADAVVASIESEWGPSDGFFWNIRQGVFRESEFKRAHGKIASIPALAESLVPSRVVSLLWYVPLFMHWQTERVRERGGDDVAYSKAINEMTAEIERILGVP